MRPLGNGMPRIPARPVVQPRRKMSQWKPGGLRSGNSDPWAMSEDTGSEVSVGFGRKSRLIHTVMVEPKQNGQEDSERDGEEDLSHTDIPEMYKPISVLSGMESLACRQGLNMHILHVAVVNEASEEDDCQWCSIVLDEFSHVPVKKVAIPQNVATVGKAQH